MINVVLPLAANLYFDSAEYLYPKPLIEVRGKPIIQLALESLASLPDPKRFIFILNRKDDSKFHLQDTMRLLAGERCETVLLEGNSKGAACSVLMAIRHIGGKEPLVIANADQVFHISLARVIQSFAHQRAEAGVICFPSVHPRWSYVRLDDSGRVIEAAEKRPLSQNAIAGFYYFAEGQQFVRLAMKSIEKGSEVNGQYFVAPVLNEYVLDDRKIAVHTIGDKDFRSFYSIQKIEEAQRDAG